MTQTWRQEGLACFTPRPRVTVSEWSDAHRMVTGGPEPGRWRTSRVPYLKQILDAISDPDVERIVIQTGAQMGKSSVLECAIGFFAHADPSAVMIVQPTEAAARGFSKERVSPMFEASPVLRPLISHTAKDADATILLKLYPGGFLSCAWASSSVQLASRPIRVLLGDELDRWPTETGADGDPWAQACARTTTFGSRRKIVAASTPTIDGQSRIAKLYEESDQRRYHVPCPHCGVLQPLEWARLHYKRDGVVDLDHVFYECEACAGHIEERHRPQMIADGAWAAHNPGHPVRGYHVSALVSPWVTWRELAAEWVRAVEDRDANAKRAFYNLRLGEVWREQAERITVEALEKNREEYAAEIPDPVLLLTAGVDTQDDRVEAFVVGWGEHRESWAIEYAIILGNTDDLGPQGPWAALDQFLARAWTKSDGSSMTLSCALVDSGGHRTAQVYRWTAERDARLIYACHGVGGAKPIVGKPTTTTLRSWLIPVGSDTAKATVYSRLALETSGAGYCHFPIGAGFDDEYFKGLLSERLVIKRGKRIWERAHRRNEPVDCAAYALAAMELVIAQNPALLTGARAAANPPPAPRRRILSRGVSE